VEEIFKRLAVSVALTVELGAAVIIAFGALEALWGTAKTFFVGGPKTGKRKAVWLRFGVWLLLGLEFELAADIVRSAIAPAWKDIGQLASIALIRTFLNFFLEKDLEKYGEPPGVRV
jgi:uncharacterized membrane protein